MRSWGRGPGAASGRRLSGATALSCVTHRFGDSLLPNRSNLYFEDDDDIRETIGTLLEGEGREVEELDRLQARIFAAAPQA